MAEKLCIEIADGSSIFINLFAFLDVSITIGVNGAPGAGKDTFCALLARKIAGTGLSVQTTSFADPLYEEVAELVIEYYKGSAYFDEYLSTLILDDTAISVIYNFVLDYVKSFPVNIDSYDRTILKELIIDNLQNRDHRYFGNVKERCRPFLRWWGTEFRRNVYDEDYWVKKALAKNKSKIILRPDMRLPNELSTCDVKIYLSNPRVPARTDHISETAIDYKKLILEGSMYPIVNNYETIEKFDSAIRVAYEK